MFLLALWAGLRFIDTEPFSPQGEQGVQIKPQHEVLSEVSLS